VTVLVGGPIAGRLRLEINEAEPGPFEVSLYDLQGRRVLRHEVHADSAAPKVLDLELHAGKSGLQPGVYFVRVVDAAGRSSPAAKMVVL
jgi:hypothetical protein